MDAFNGTNRIYKVNEDLEQEVVEILPLSFREDLFKKVVNPTTRLDIAVTKIAKEKPETRFSPKQLAYIVALNPEAPRALGTMMRAIVKRKPNFPSYIMEIKSKSTYSTDKTNELYKEFGILDEE